MVPVSSVEVTPYFGNAAFGPYLLGIRILQAHEPTVISLKEFNSMRRRHIFICGQRNGLVHGSRMAIDSPANDWL